MYTATQNQTQPRRSQIAFRFDNALIARIKLTARSRGLSLNDYAKALFERVTLLDSPILPENYTASDELRAMTGFIKGFTKEQLENDPKLEYLLRK